MMSIASGQMNKEQLADWLQEMGAKLSPPTPTKPHSRPWDG